MANIGNLALILALALAVYGTVASFLAARQARERFRQAAVRAYAAAAGLVLVAVVSLAYLLQIDDFSNVYVYSHSNEHLPWFFKLTAVWGGSSGSLLWWTFVMMAYACVFLWATRKAPKLMMSWALVFVGMGLVFFLIINNFVSNPFRVWSQIAPGGETSPFTPRDGTGLNPQLQHWAMIIHPPLLYTGYIGFLFPFSMAMGALITRMEGREWLPMIRVWTLTAWLILGVGIILGGAWAYMELGWGGYWAWDPVENASFMPWLLATAFIHSAMAQEKRGMFKLWNVLLLIGSYLMCIFGTFITRSGLISSVHSFAKSDIGYYFIGYLAVTAVLSAIVLIMRRNQLTDDNAVDSMVSREVGLLFNNVLFIAVCVTMLLATTYPMMTEAIYGVKRELRHGFYNTVEIPIFLAMLLLMAIGPIVTWKRTSRRLLRERFLWPTVVMVLVFIAGMTFNRVSWMANVSFAVIAFLGFTIVQEFGDAVRRRAKRAGENAVRALYTVVQLNKRRYGGYLAHFGVLVMAIGLTGAAFNSQAKKELGVGEILNVGTYTFQVESIGERDDPNYVALTAKVNLIEEGKVARSFYPEQRYYKASDSQASEVSIVSTLAKDYYVVIAGSAPSSVVEHPVAVFHVYVNPLVIWIWIGGVLMALATIVAMLPEPARARVPAEAPVGAGELA